MQRVVAPVDAGTIVPVRETIVILSGSLAGLMCVIFGARRSAKQPVPYTRKDEETLLSWARGGGLAADLNFEANDILSAERREEFMSLQKTNTGSEVTKAVKRAAERVAEFARERQELTGALGFEAVRGEPPYKRIVKPPSFKRRTCGIAAGGIGSAFVLHFFDKVSDPHLRGVGLLSLMVIVCGGLVIALVDIDTLYLDLLTMASMGVASWGSAVAFTFANQRARDLLLGLATVVVWVAALETINLIYKIIRKTDGVGFGDAMIIAVTAGVPVAVTGEFMVGFFGVVCGFILAGFIQIPLALSRKEGARTAFALGPYLCVGWLASWFVVDNFNVLGAGV